VTNPTITSMITSTGGEDVSGKSATNASDRYWRQEYAECIMSRHPTVVRMEFPESDDIFIWDERARMRVTNGRLVK
jgi:hypothetical protein